MTVSIYKISFSDGAAYVGQTKNNIFKRIKQHRKASSNPHLYQRLNSDEPYVYELLCEVPDEYASYVEMQEIRKLDKPLNLEHTGKHAHQQQPKTCHVCRRWLSASDYHKDSTRVDNLSNKCKECKRYISTQMRRAGERNQTTSQAYQQAVREIKRRFGAQP